MSNTRVPHAGAGADSRASPGADSSASPGGAAPTLDAALDASLRRALPPPALPAKFHLRLQAALARAAAEPGVPEVRLRLEREQRELLRELRAGYVRMQRRTLGTMIGAAFAVGAACALALPWLEVHLGALAPVVLAGAGAAVGLAVALGVWRERLGVSAASRRRIST